MERVIGWNISSTDNIGMFSWIFIAVHKQEAVKSPQNFTNQGQLISILNTSHMYNKLKYFFFIQSSFESTYLGCGLPNQPLVTRKHISSKKVVAFQGVAPSPMVRNKEFFRQFNFLDSFYYQRLRSQRPLGALGVGEFFISIFLD